MFKKLKRFLRTKREQDTIAEAKHAKAAFDAFVLGIRTSVFREGWDWISKRPYYEEKALRDAFMRGWNYDSDYPGKIPHDWQEYGKGYGEGYLEHEKLENPSELYLQGRKDGTTDIEIWEKYGKRIDALRDEAEAERGLIVNRWPSLTSEVPR